MIADIKGKVYGYARRSTDAQVLSLEAQKDRISQKAAALGCTVDHVFVETESAREVAWDHRTAFKEVCQLVRPGDALIVWKLNRVDRDFWRMLRAAEFFCNRQVRLIVLEFGGMEMDLATAQGRMFAMIMACMSDIEQECRIEAVKRGMSILCPPGELWYRIGCAKPRFGRKWKWVTVPKEFATRRSGSTRRQREVWDEHECDLIRELWFRYSYLHQSFADIGRVFLARKERTTDDERSPWVNVLARHTPECIANRPRVRPTGGWGCHGPKRCPKYADFKRITTVAKWYAEEMKNGTLPAILQLTPARIADLRQELVIDVCASLSTLRKPTASGNASPSTSSPQQ